MACLPRMGGWGFPVTSALPQVNLILLRLPLANLIPAEIITQTFYIVISQHG